MDALIDSTIQDYQLASGRLTPDPAGGLANAVYLRLMTPKGRYWAEPLLGSRLHELQRDKDVASKARLAQQYAEQALQPLLADGRANRIGVTVTRQPGRLLLAIEIVKPGGQVITFQHPVSVAG